MEVEQVTGWSILFRQMAHNSISRTTYLLYLCMCLIASTSSRLVCHACILKWLDLIRKRNNVHDIYCILRVLWSGFIFITA